MVNYILPLIPKKRIKADLALIDFPLLFIISYRVKVISLLVKLVISSF